MQPPHSSRAPVTHGLRGRSLHLDGFVLTQAQYPPDFALRRHDHDLPSWTYVSSGTLTETFRHRDEYCIAGMLLSKPASAAHANRYGPTGASCLLIEVVDPRRIQGREMERIFDDVTICAAGPAPGWARRIMHLLSEPDPPVLLIESLLLNIAAEWTRRRTTRRSPVAGNRRWLETVRDRLSAEFRAPPSIATLAASVQVHPVYLCQAFRSAFGCSPGEFVRRQRVEHARDRLIRGDADISTIALSTGFSDQSHFTRQFRASVGLPPAKFRAQHAGVRAGQP
ncbi:MAG TPA: AraC family transcriptional regulator [Gemmatimonadota bacterium]|nr:AraC family transcriptional regulator [Gemmatimonadota bacterium]